MDPNNDQMQLKKILVDLEDEHKHLQVSVSHLEQEIEKREIDIKRLLTERDLSRSNLKSDFSSEFAREVDNLLRSITMKSREISSLLKL